MAPALHPADPGPVTPSTSESPIPVGAGTSEALVDPQNRDYRLALHALHESLGYRRPLTIAAIAMRQHQDEVAERFGFLAQAPEAYKHQILGAIHEQIQEALLEFGVTEEVLGKISDQQLQMLLYAFSEHIAGRGPLVGAATLATPEASSGGASKGPARPAPKSSAKAGAAVNQSGASAPVAPAPKAPSAPAGTGGAAARAVSPNTQAPRTQAADPVPAPVPAPAANRAEQTSPEQTGPEQAGAAQTGGEVALEQPAPTPDAAPGLRQAVHAVAEQTEAREQNIQSAAPTPVDDLAWPSGEGAEAWRLRHHYLSLYLAQAKTSRQLGLVGEEIGEARNTLARTLDQNVRTKKATLHRLWGKLETRVRAYLRSHPEALRFGTTEIGRGSPYAAPAEMGRSGESHEYTLGALIINARAVIDRQEIMRLLTEGGADRDLAERLASGMKHRTLSAEEVERFSGPLKAASEQGKLRRQQSRQAWAELSRLLRETPMSKEVLMGLATKHQLPLSLSEMRALQLGEGVDDGLIMRATRLSQVLSPEELEQARQQCYERVKDTDHPNAVTLTWVREAREELRQAMKRDAAATQQRVAEIGLSQKAVKLEENTHLSDSRLSVTAGEASKIIEAVRYIASEPIHAVGDAQA